LTLHLLIFPLLAFLLVVLTMPVFIRVAKRYRLYDKPDDDRKLHTGDIPFIGGICFSLAFVIITVVMVWFDGIPLDRPQYHKLATMSVYIGEAACIILFLGVLDDLRDLPFTRKFIFQFFATFFLILGAAKAGVLPKVFDVQSSSILWNSVGTTISVLWFVGMTNAINMIDGMDGLAGGTVLLACGAMAALALLWGNVMLALVLLILIGSIAGFLYYNLPPARIFMGDTGSMFLGFAVGVASWLLMDNAPVRLISVFVPIVILGLPITDTLLAFVRRIIRGQNPFSADRFHIHHMMKARFNLSTPATVYSLLGINVVLAGGGIFVAMLPEIYGWLIIGLLLCIMISLLYLLGYARLVFPVGPLDASAAEVPTKIVGPSNRRNGNGTISAAQTSLREER
jgi:UDP-GlcNAc:undecaprenyl-phosphate/decaprenyl-phosphate GlcNAc-1-phosphate transferase